MLFSSIRVLLFFVFFPLALSKVSLLKPMQQEYYDSGNETESLSDEGNRDTPDTEMHKYNLRKRNQPSKKPCQTVQEQKTSTTGSQRTKQESILQKRKFALQK